MAKLSKSEAAQALAAMSPEQKDQIEKMMADGAGASWAIRQVQSATKQDEARAEAAEPSDMDKAAAAVVGFGKGVTGTPKPENLGSEVPEEAAYEYFRKQENQAKKDAAAINPSAGKIPVVDIDVNSELAGSLVVPTPPIAGMAAKGAGKLASKVPGMIGKAAETGVDVAGAIVGKARDATKGAALKAASLPEGTKTALKTGATLLDLVGTGGTVSSIARLGSGGQACR
jgi:hypothetical protein